jgi:hypothetical protein
MYSSRFFNIVISSTSLLIFYLWNIINKLSFENESVKYLIILLTSYGTYKLLVSVSIFLTKRLTILKKLFLGNAYLEGTWVGFYIGAEGHPRFFREIFEQELDSLVIRGRSNNENNRFHAQWNTAIVNVDIKKGELSYMYDISSIHENSHNNGMAFFDLDRDSSLKAPKKMIGYSTDLHIGKRIKSYSVKLSNKTDISFETALEESKKIYLRNKDNF